MPRYLVYCDHCNMPEVLEKNVASEDIAINIEASHERNNPGHNAHYDPLSFVGQVKLFIKEKLGVPIHFKKSK